MSALVFPSLFFPSLLLPSLLLPPSSFLLLLAPSFLPRRPTVKKNVRLTSREKEGRTHCISQSKNNLFYSTLLSEMLAKEVHVTTHSRTVAAFVEQNRCGLICFRCGQQGHVRSQCLTYKIRLCWYKDARACSDPFCTFAHGREELRSPWRARCVRVVKQTGGNFVCIGCNSSEHTFRKCPLHQDLIF